MLHPTASENEHIIPFLRSFWGENLGLGGDQYVIV